jgi:hypothetical protein
MSGERPQACSTRDALTDMLETASRRLNKALRIAAGGSANGADDMVAQAKAAVDSLTTRIAAHRDVHHC